MAPIDSERYRHQASSSSLKEWNRSASKPSRSLTIEELEEAPTSTPQSGPQIIAEPKSSSGMTDKDMARAKSVDAGLSPSPQSKKKWGLGQGLRSLLRSSSEKSPKEPRREPSSDLALVALDDVIQAQLSRASEADDSAHSNANSDAISFKFGMGSITGGGHAQARSKITRISPHRMSGASFLEQQLTDARESIIEEEEDDVEQSKTASFDLHRMAEGRLGSSESDWDVAGSISKLAPASGQDTNDSKIEVKAPYVPAAPYVPPSPFSSTPRVSLTSDDHSGSMSLPSQIDLVSRVQSIASHLNALTDEELLDPIKSAELLRKLMDLAKSPSHQYQPLSHQHRDAAFSDVIVRVGAGSNDSHGLRRLDRGVGGVGGGGHQRSRISSRASTLSQSSLSQRATAAATSKQTSSSPPLYTVDEGSVRSARSMRSEITLPQLKPSSANLSESQDHSRAATQGQGACLSITFK